MLENPTTSQGERMNPALLSKGQRGDLCKYNVNRGVCRGFPSELSPVSLPTVAQLGYG